MIYVTHDQVEAMTLADRIVVLEFGEIAQVGSPRELYERPENLFVAQFIGSPKMNIVDAAHVRGSVANGAQKVGCRPEHLEFCSEGDGILDGTVEIVEYLGADEYVLLNCGDAGPVTQRTNGTSNVKPGQTVGLKPGPDGKVHAFSAAGQAIH